MISSEVTNLLKECFEKRTLLAWQGSFKFSDQLKSAGLAVHLGLNIFYVKLSQVYMFLGPLGPLTVALSVRNS